MPDVRRFPAAENRRAPNRPAARLVARLRVAPLLAASVLVLAFDPRALGDSVRLASGSVLLADVTGVDEEGVTLVRADTGGEVRIPWSRLAPSEEERLKRDAGLLLAPAAEETTRADRLALDGGEEVVGRIEREDAGVLVVKTSKGIRKIERSRVLRTERVTVSVLEIETKEELIARKRAENPEDTAESNFRLALYCLSLYAYPEAKEHLERTAALDRSYQSVEVKRRLVEVEERIRRAEETAILGEIARARLLGRTSDALARFEDFRAKFPKSPLLREAEALRDSVLETRKAVLTRAVSTDFFTFLDKISQNHARDRELELAEARSLAGKQLGAEAFKAAAERSGISEEEAKALFGGRSEGSPKRASYGTGTYLLGDKAREGLLEAAEEEKREPERKPPPGYSRSGRSSSRATSLRKVSAPKPPSPEEWWAAASAGERAQWLRASFAERSGEVQVSRLDAIACPVCAGEGSISVAGTTTSGDSIVFCPRCNGIGFERVVYYR